MTAQIARLAPDATADQVIQAIERDGGAIIEDFLRPETLAGLKADLLPQLQTVSTGVEGTFEGGRTRRLSRLFARTRHLAEVATDPRFLDAAKAFVCRPLPVWRGEVRGEITPELRIGATQAIQIGPGEGAQPLHRDDTSFMWRHPTHGREGRLQIMLALSDFTAANGGTLVIPGSHLWDDDRKPERSEAIPTEMRAGSAVLWVGSTYHGGGENTTDTLRTGVTMTLDAAHVRQEENMYLSLDHELVRSYPEQIQRLLGWSAGVNHMGWVEIDGQMVDPIVLLQGKTLAPA